MWVGQGQEYVLLQLSYFRCKNLALIVVFDVSLVMII